jgi:hypothetical protein
MTTTTQKIEKINDIFNCKLLLEDGTEFTIPLREDGYIYANVRYRQNVYRENSYLQ